MFEQVEAMQRIQAESSAEAQPQADAGVASHTPGDTTTPMRAEEQREPKQAKVQPPSEPRARGAAVTEMATDAQTGSALLSGLRLRWFTPREMLAVHGFPETYSVPPTVSAKQMRRCIGNSLSVVVVAELIRFALASKATT